MNIKEMTVDQISGFNQRAIEEKKRKDPTCQENHNLVRSGDLSGALGSIFYQSINGYNNLPIEKMAGMLLYRVSQRQAFENGNKRTALLSCVFFLQNHGLNLRIDMNEVFSLLSGFATGADGAPPAKTEEDAIQYVFDNVMPRT